MKHAWNRFRLTLGAAAVMGASLAFAQAQPAPEAAVVPPPPPAAVDAAKEAQHQLHKKAHKPVRKHGGKYATPQQHEAAAVAGERRRGVGPANPAHSNQLDEYQRNALKRCDVFKADDDRRACVERVRQPQISGSVQGGGVIREYTQTVPVAPAQPVAHPHPHAPVPGQVPPTDHMLHPPVQPVR